MSLSSDGVCRGQSPKMIRILPRGMRSHGAEMVKHMSLITGGLYMNTKLVGMGNHRGVEDFPRRVTREERASPPTRPHL